MVWWPIGGLLPLAQRDLLAKFETEALAAFGVGPDDVTLDGRALKVANVIYTVEYDTRRLKREDLPRTWEDLLAPRWQGRIVGATLLVPGVPATIGMLKGEAAALTFARSLRDSAKVTMVPSSAVAREMVHRRLGPPRAPEDSRHQGRLAAIASPVGPRHRDIIGQTQTLAPAGAAGTEDSRHQGRLVAIASPLGPRHRDIIGHIQTLAPAGAAGTARDARQAVRYIWHVRLALPARLRSS